MKVLLQLILMTTACWGLTYDYNYLCLNEKKGYVRHPSSCHKFIRCSHQKAYEFQCPSNLLWHHEIKTCDFAYRTQCLLKQQEYFDPVKTKEKQSSVLKKANRNFAKTSQNLSKRLKRNVGLEGKCKTTAPANVKHSVNGVREVMPNVKISEKADFDYNSKILSDFSKLKDLAKSLENPENLTINSLHNITSKENVNLNLIKNSKVSCKTPIENYTVKITDQENYNKKATTESSVHALEKTIENRKILHQFTLNTTFQNYPVNLTETLFKDNLHNKTFIKENSTQNATISYFNKTVSCLKQFSQNKNRNTKETYNSVKLTEALFTSNTTTTLSNLSYNDNMVKPSLNSTYFKQLKPSKKALDLATDNYVSSVNLTEKFISIKAEEENFTAAFATEDDVKLMANNTESKFSFNIAANNNSVNLTEAMLKAQHSTENFNKKNLYNFENKKTTQAVQNKKKLKTDLAIERLSINVNLTEPTLTKFLTENLVLNLNSIMQTKNGSDFITQQLETSTEIIEEFQENSKSSVNLTESSLNSVKTTENSSSKLTDNKIFKTNGDVNYALKADKGDLTENFLSPVKLTESSTIEDIATENASSKTDIFTHKIKTPKDKFTENVNHTANLTESPDKLTESITVKIVEHIAEVINFTSQDFKLKSKNEDLQNNTTAVTDSVNLTEATTNAVNLNQSKKNINAISFQLFKAAMTTSNELTESFTYNVNLTESSTNSVKITESYYGETLDTAKENKDVKIENLGNDFTNEIAENVTDSVNLTENSSAKVTANIEDILNITNTFSDKENKTADLDYNATTENGSVNLIELTITSLTKELIMLNESSTMVENNFANSPEFNNVTNTLGDLVESHVNLTENFSGVVTLTDINSDQLTQNNKYNKNATTDLSYDLTDADNTVYLTEIFKISSSTETGIFNMSSVPLLNSVNYVDRELLKADFTETSINVADFTDSFAVNIKESAKNSTILTENFAVKTTNSVDKITDLKENKDSRESSKSLQSQHLTESVNETPTENVYNIEQNKPKEVFDIDNNSKAYNSTYFSDVTATTVSEMSLTQQDILSDETVTQDPRLPFRAKACQGPNNHRQVRALKCHQYYQCFAGWAFLLNCHEGWRFEVEKGKCVLDKNQTCDTE